MNAVNPSAGNYERRITHRDPQPFLGYAAFGRGRTEVMGIISTADGV